MNAIGIILAGGTGQLASALPYAIAAAVGVLVITGAGAVLLFKGRTRLERMRGEDGGEVIDDALPRFFTHKPAQAAPWPDEDTIVAGNVLEALERMLKEDGR